MYYQTNYKIQQSLSSIISYLQEKQKLFKGPANDPNVQLWFHQFQFLRRIIKIITQDPMLHCVHQPQAAILFFQSSPNGVLFRQVLMH
jgi:hypothetical protein